MPNEFIIKNGLIVESGTTTVTGSVTATGGFTGSLFGTASVATSLAGGALTNFIEGFSSATQATSFLSASNAADTVNISIDPKGSGSILGAVPDGTAVGGNARGIFAIDLQLTRSLATQVASGPYSIIGGGLVNRISSTRTNSYCIIGGGNNNVISQLFGATIVGGGNNTIGDNDGWECTILGGASNTITARLSATTVGGNSNTISGNGSFATVGGRANSSSGESAAIAGGRSNTANGTYATIGGGQSNTANGSNWATVGGGFGNSAGANGNVVAGGYGNSCGGNGYSAIVGGESNSLGSQFYGFIGAGQSNSNQASYGVICGGRSNTVSAGSSDGTIGGGQSNTIFNSQWTVIGGGQSNSSNPGAGQSNQHNVIAGGYLNSANGNLKSYNSIGGGTGNRTLGSYSVVIGGASNLTSGDYTTVLGGLLNTASVDYSLAAGRRAKASHSGSFVWADSTDADYSSNGNNTFNVRAIGGSFFTGSMTVTGSLIVAPASAVELQVTSTGVKIGNAIGDIHSVTGSLNITGSVTATGDVVARTNLKSMYQAGDEGGEIFLSTPATNTTIPNGVTIDVYRNRLRIFEQGGSANGYYLEMPSGSAGVGTNLSPIGFTGNVPIAGNPPGFQTLTFSNGILISVS